jgi:hypothetical protein
MSGAIPLLPIYVFTAWKGGSLPLTFLGSIKNPKKLIYQEHSD